MLWRKRKVIKIKAIPAERVERVIITTEFIKLDSALKLAGEAETGGHAKPMVSEGKVFVNGEVRSKGKKLLTATPFREAPPSAKYRQVRLMFVKTLKAENFRNLERIELEPSEGVNIIYGENAQGKTNLLELIWLFTGFKSFRGAKDSELVRFGEDFSNGSGVFDGRSRRRSL